MGRLFIVSTSPFKRTESRTHIYLARKDDGVIFIQNGVYVSLRIPDDLAEKIEEKKKEGVKFYALKEDLEARGIKTFFGEIVDYDGFLELIEKYDKVIH